MPVLKYGYIIRHALYYNYGINHDGSDDRTRNSIA